VAEVASIKINNICGVTIHLLINFKNLVGRRTDEFLCSFEKTANRIYWFTT